MLDVIENFEWVSWWGLGLAVLIALVAVIIIVGIIMLVVRVLAREWPGIYKALAPVRRRFRVMLALVAVWVAINLTLPQPDWADVIDQAFLIAGIAVGAWLLMAVVSLAISQTLLRYPLDVPDNRAARRVRTQMMLVRRLAAVVIGIIAAGSILLTFPGAQAAGASLLASAGLVSVIAGLAAQSALGNVFAGMQLAFSDAIRVDDVVIADGEWGRIEEITLTYVVVSIWDKRRLILPSTYFTTTPFQNWTRKGTELLGPIGFDLDWQVSPAEMRKHLLEIVKSTDLWDGQTANVQITDSTGGYVRARVLVSAANSGAMWDLQCYVREAMVEWLQKKNPGALPRTRVLMVEKEAAPRSRGKGAEETGGLFSGTPEAEARGKEFTAAIPIQEPKPE